LQFTTAQSSGFLLYLNVKLVPFFARIILGREISIPTWISAFVAFMGTALISYDGTSVNIGDVWSICAAACSAMFIIRMESATEKVPNAAALNAACLWTVTMGSTLWLLISASSSAENLTDTLSSSYHSVLDTFQAHPLAILYLGGVATALANYIQTKAQKGIKSERASIIYALDPVYGAGFAYVLLGETLSTNGMVGALLITLAAATNAYTDLGKSVEDTE